MSAAIAGLIVLILVTIILVGIAYLVGALIGFLLEPFRRLRE
jgi:hypothetical protein